MNFQEAYEFTSKERLAVRSAVTDTGPPQSALLGMAVTPVIETPEVLAARITREQQKWRRVIEQSGAKVD